MSRIGYIITLIYLPFLVLYSMAPWDSMTIDQRHLLTKAYFIIQALTITGLSAQIFYFEFSNHRKVLMGCMIFIQSMFIFYLIIDWDEAFIYNRVVCAIFSGLSIVAYILAIIKTRKSQHNDR